MRVILVGSQARQLSSFFEDAHNPQPCPDKRLGKDLRNGHLVVVPLPRMKDAQVLQSLPTPRVARSPVACNWSQYGECGYMRWKGLCHSRLKLLRSRDVNLRVAVTRGFVPAEPACRQTIQHTCTDCHPRLLEV
jgi:hypothetical protein